MDMTHIIKENINKDEYGNKRKEIKLSRANDSTHDLS